MNTAPQFAKILLRLYSAARDWLKRSRIEEEAVWHAQLKDLQTQAADQTDDDEREETERRIRGLGDLLARDDRRLTEEYADLLFAYGLARVGATAEAAALEAGAAARFEIDDAAHRLLFRAFQYRIAQARQGAASVGPLPSNLLATLDGEGVSSLEAKSVRYIVDRLRGSLLILEPAEAVDAFRTFKRPDTPLGRAVMALCKFSDPRQLERRTRQLLGKFKKADAQLNVLRAALDLFPRLSPTFARELLERAYVLLGELPPVGDLRARARERTQSAESFAHLDHLSDAYVEALAAHTKEFRDLSDVSERVTVLEVIVRRAADGADAALARSVVRQLIQIVDAQRGDDLFAVVPVLAGSCLQALQRLRLREDLETLLLRLPALIHGPLGRGVRRGRDEKDHVLLMLNVASGWLFLGRRDQAAPMLEEARAAHVAPLPNHPQYLIVGLLYRYVAAVTQLPVELALKTIEEAFARMGPMTDLFTTRTHFSLVRLKIIDAVVRAVVHLAHPDDDVDDYLAVSLN